MAAWVPLWLAAAWAAVRLATRVALAAVLVLAVALRLAAASGTTPSISSDMYRYSWDAHVQLSGVDPYRYPPDAPRWSGYAHLRGCGRPRRPASTWASRAAAPCSTGRATAPSTPLSPRPGSWWSTC